MRGATNSTFKDTIKNLVEDATNGIHVDQYGHIIIVTIFGYNPNGTGARTLVSNIPTCKYYALGMAGDENSNYAGNMWIHTGSHHVSLNPTSNVRLWGTLIYLTDEGGGA